MVVVTRDLQTPRDLQRSLHPFVDHFLESAEGLGKEAVLRHRHDRHVEQRVEVFKAREVHGFEIRLFLFFQDPLQTFDLLVGGRNRRPIGGRRFQYLSNPEQLHERDLQIGQTLANQVLLVEADEHSLAVLDDHALMGLEDLDRLTQGRSTHAEHGGQISLGRELLTLA